MTTQSSAPAVKSVADAMNRHYSTVIVGGGQAGLSMSYCLKQRGIDHLVIEKNALTHTWRTQRWDTFCLVTPNWQCALPDYPYRGNDPYGFMKREELIAYLDGFIAHVNAPVCEGVAVQRVAPAAKGYGRRALERVQVTMPERVDDKTGENPVRRKPKVSWGR